MKKFNFSVNSFFFFVSMVFMIMIAGLYIQFGEVIKETNKEISRIEISRAKALTQKITEYIKDKAACDFSLLFKDESLRDDISSFLSQNITDEFKYIYVIFRDKKGFYRYLLDGSCGTDKGEFGQRFNPLLENLWKNCFECGSAVYGFQNKADGLWITYLSPIKVEGVIKAVLVLDISTKEYQNLNKFLTPLHNFLKIFLSVLVAIVLVVSIQMYMFYAQRKKSIVDSLTKLYNRNYLKEIWGRIELENIAILMLDIDHFKSVNDRYGHGVGDMVLESIAKKLLNETRLEDRVIRYGGEEFLIFLKWPKNDNEVIQIAERIRQNIANEKIRIDEKLNIKTTVSIGVNLNPSENKTLKNAIEVADKMLYIAKNKGRDRVVCTKDKV